MKNEIQLARINEIGLRLHRTEAAIGVGRRALMELQRQDPVNELAVEAVRLTISEHRLERNTLRHELETVRPLPSYPSTWIS